MRAFSIYAGRKGRTLRDGEKRGEGREVGGMDPHVHRLKKEEAASNFFWPSCAAMNWAR